MVLLMLFAFIAGVVTVLSPCILPVLPIVLSSSVDNSKQRPIGVIIGFVLSFTFFTLFLSTLVQATGVSADAVRLTSVVIIFLFGLSLLLPQVQAYMEKAFTFFTRFSPKTQRIGLLGGVLVGFSLGLLWTPCVGPILAAIISLAITGTVTSQAFFITLAYATGTAIPMFAIMVGGRQLLNKVPWLLKNTANIQKGFGVVMMVTAIGIYFNLDRQFQTWVLTTFPNYGTGLTQFEDIEIVRDQLDELQPGSARLEPTGQPTFEMTDATDGQLPRLFQAPELQPSGEWFNSEPLTMGDLRGQVVLVDFWTYSCINCIRTLPYLRDWHDQYADQGLVILGVHSPEFEFEKRASNLEEAIADFELEYPIFQDNEFLTWRAYNNRYWPAKYLVDKNGVVRYTHFGEGEYLETENAIRQLLEEQPLSEAEQRPVEADTPDFTKRQTPETYLGYDRARQYVQTNLVKDQVNQLTFNQELPDDAVGLNGSWYLHPEHIEAQADGAELGLHFLGQKVFLVMELAPGVDQANVKVMLNGQALPAEYQTEDSNEVGVITVTEARKYDILDLGADYGRNILSLEFDQGVRAFAFTFGS